MRNAATILLAVLAPTAVGCGGGKFAVTPRAEAAARPARASSGNIAAKRLAAATPITFPATLYDYVGHAVTNLPPHYRTGTVTASDFTPPDNPISNSGANLGRVLFYDKQLSANNTVACGSCHIQRHGFGDPRQFSDGFQGGLTRRHAMALGNVRYYRRGRYFWDERAISLEMLALMPIADPIEMGSDLKTLPTKLSVLPYYPPLFQAAFGTTEITTERIGNALAQFLRSMVTYQSRYDLPAAKGGSDFSEEFTEQELQGRQLFLRNHCHLCHSTDVHTAVSAQNNGLDPYITDRGTEGGKFKVPSLRNVAVRERFMHDGRLSTLEQVIEFYNSGVQDNPALSAILRNPDGTVLRLNLSEQDKAALKAFLETLTDEKFLNDAKFSNPF